MLKFFQPEKAAAPRDTTALAARLKSAVTALGKLSVFPETATKAMAVANNPKSALSDVAAVIERDTGLAFAILKLANSALYHTGQPVDTLSQAVARLGLRECQSLLMAIGMRGVFRSAGAATREASERLCQHCFLTACLCRAFNRSLDLGYTGQEFSAGLCHDVGRLLLATIDPQAFASADPLDFQEDGDVLESERSVLGTDHCELGALFAQKNELPVSLVSAIRFHHTPEVAGANRDVVALLSAADHLANHLQRGAPFDDYAAGANPGWAILNQVWSEDRKDKLVARLPAIAAQGAADSEELYRLLAG
jgi:HD-like signal output (HDOD) protein